jgi:hypothetical protein
MSLSQSHDQIATTVTDITDSEARSGFVGLAVAIGFASTVSIPMMVWLCMLVCALWDGLRWLVS